MSTCIFSKTQEERAEFEAVFDEVIDHIELLNVNPTTSIALQVELSAQDNKAYILASGGQNDTTYACMAAVHFVSGKIDTAAFVILVSQQSPIPYKTQAPDQFQDLVGEIQAGQSAVASAVFTVPNCNLKNGYVTWELLTSDNECLASGNAYECIVRNDGLGNTLIAKSVITCPSDTGPTIVTTKYQIRYTLHVDGKAYYQFENLTVASNVTVPLGTPDVVELHGARAHLSIVTSQPYQYMQCSIYKDNQEIASAIIKDAAKVSSGWLYSLTADTQNLPVSLENYTVVFSYGNASPTEFQESSKLWIINASIQTACGDILARVNKARTTLYGSPDLLYPIPTILLWMRRGMDRFNGAYGIFTNFTMTNAKGGIREYWLMWTELMAIQAQYLAEGEKAFDYSGAAISLNVDRTGYLDSMANSIKGDLDNEFKPFKQNLVNKGHTSGDGSGDVNVLGRGAMGSVGVALTPTNTYGSPFYGPYAFTAAWR